MSAETPPTGTGIRLVPFPNNGRVPKPEPPKQPPSLMLGFPRDALEVVIEREIENVTESPRPCRLFEFVKPLRESPQQIDLIRWLWGTVSARLGVDDWTTLPAHYKVFRLPEQSGPIGESARWFWTDLLLLKGQEHGKGYYFRHPRLELNGRRLRMKFWNHYRDWSQSNCDPPLYCTPLGDLFCLDTETRILRSWGGVRTAAAANFKKLREGGFLPEHEAEAIAELRHQFSKFVETDRHKLPGRFRQWLVDNGHEKPPEEATVDEKLADLTEALGAIWRLIPDDRQRMLRRWVEDWRLLTKTGGKEWGRVRREAQNGE